MAKWNVKLADDKTGNVIEYPLTTKWDAKKVDDDFVMRTAAAQAWLESKKQIRFVPIEAALA